MVVQSKGTNLEIFEHVYKIMHIVMGCVQLKGTNLEIFEHVYNIMHIVRGGPVGYMYMYIT